MLVGGEPIRKRQRWALSLIWQLTATSIVRRHQINRYRSQKQQNWLCRRWLRWAEAQWIEQRIANPRVGQATKIAQAATWREALEWVNDGPTTLQEARAIASAALHPLTIRKFRMVVLAAQTKTGGEVFPTVRLSLVATDARRLLRR